MATLFEPEKASSRRGSFESPVQGGNPLEVSWAAWESADDSRKNPDVITVEITDFKNGSTTKYKMSFGPDDRPVPIVDATGNLRPVAMRYEKGLDELNEELRLQNQPDSVRDMAAVKQKLADNMRYSEGAELVKKALTEFTLQRADDRALRPEQAPQIVEFKPPEDPSTLIVTPAAAEQISAATSAVGEWGAKILKGVNEAIGISAAEAKQVAPAGPPLDIRPAVQRLAMEKPAASDLAETASAKLSAPVGPVAAKAVPVNKANQTEFIAAPGPISLTTIADSAPAKPTISAKPVAKTDYDPAHMGQERALGYQPPRGWLKGVALTGQETETLRQALQDPHNLAVANRAQAIILEHGGDIGNGDSPNTDGIIGAVSTRGIQHELGVEPAAHPNHRQKPQQHPKPPKHRHEPTH